MTAAALTLVATPDPAPAALTVYSKPACVQCDATYRALSREGLSAGEHYTVVDLTEDPGAYAYVMSLGYLQVPVVVVGDEHWSGYRPDRIRSVAAEILAERYGGAA